MNCNKFADNLMDYIENELGSIDSNEMLNHLESCDKCREIYERRLSTIHSFQQVLAFPGINFTSKKQSILDSIDKNKYDTKLISKLKYGLIRNKKLIATLAAASFVFMLFPKTLRMMGIDKINIKGGYSKSSSDGQEAKKSTQDNLAITEASKESTNSIHENVLKELEELKNDIPVKGMPWNVYYADKGNIIFGNYTHLLVYNQDMNKITNAIDLRDLGIFGELGEKSSFDIKVSPDGNYVVIGNSTPYKDKKLTESEKAPVYLLDFYRGRTMKLQNGNLFDIYVNWSMDCSWVVRYDMVEETVTAYDLMNWKSYEVGNFKNQGIKDIFIGEAGSLSIYGKQKYLLKAPEYKEKIQLQGTPIGFKGDRALAIENNTIYEYPSKDKVFFADLKNFNANDYFKQNGSKIIINDYKNQAILDLNSRVVSEGSLYTESSYFNWGISLKQESNNGSSKVVVLDTSDKVINSININDTNLISYPKLMDSDNFIMVDIVKGAKNAGEFEILKYNLQKGDKEVLFKN